MTTADIFNIGVKLTAPDGTVYELPELTQYQQGELQVWLEDRAHAAVDRSKADDAAKERRHHLIDVDAGLGMYEWDGPLAVEARWTPAGIAKMLVIVGKSQGMTDEKARAILRHSFREATEKLLRLRRDDPKAFALLMVGAGLPVRWTRPEESDSSSEPSPPRPSESPSPSSAGTATDSCSTSTSPSPAPTG